MTLNVPDLPDDLKKLISIATDMELTPKLRTQAIESIANVRTYEALLALLTLVASEKLTFQERDLSLKKARDIVKSER